MCTQSCASSLLEPGQAEDGLRSGDPPKSC